jgi:hypothetical protein
LALSPEYLQGLPEELENLAMQLEADIIADISRRIAKAGAITDTAEYQMMILKEMGASTEYLEKLIAEYSGQSEEAVRELVFDAAQTDSDFYEAVYSRANRPYTPFEYNEYLQQLAVAAVNQTCGELNNFTRTMGFSVRGADGSIRFTSAADTYRACMDKAFTLAAFGGTDYETAVRTATKEMTASGLQFVDYASGVRNHADVAVRRALLTGVSQMTGQISLHNARDLDTDVVEVSAHAGARPDHAEWQGLWYSISGEDKRYPQLEAATGYGTVTGLKGANCRHDFYPVIPGISERTYSDEDLRNIDPPPVTIDGKTYTYYEAEQRQRAIERAIRKTKREIIAAEASGDKDMFTAKSVLLRRQKEAYGEFSKQAGLLPRIERTGVAEYGRSISTKAVWANRKYSQNGLTSGGGSGTISSGHQMSAKGSSKQNSPDFADYLVINNPEAVLNCKKALIELGLKESDIKLDGIKNSEVLEPFVNRLKKIKEDTGMILPPIRASEYVLGESDCIAYYNPFSGELTISSRFFNSKDYLIDTMKNWANNGVMPKQSKTINYLAEHEMAHARIPDKIVETNEARAIWKKRKLTNKNDEDKYEYFADVVAIFRTNPNINDNNIIAAINYLEKEGVIIDRKI